jgi:lysophospholipase L1-like esterase
VWNKLIGTESGSYTLPTASTTTLGGVKIGNGLSITNGVLSATGGTAGAGTTEHYKGLLSDFVTMSTGSYISTGLESGIYRVLDSNKPTAMNPPFSGVDFIFIHQKIFTDFNWAYQWVYPVDNPGKIYTRRVLCGSPYTDGRQGTWTYVGNQAQLDTGRSRKILTMGDSITAKLGGSVDYPTVPAQTFPSYTDGLQYQWVKRFPDMQIYSIAYGGAKMANLEGTTNAVYNPHSFYYLATTFTDFTSYDIVTVAYGTNDEGWGIALGGVDSTDKNTVQGAMNLGIQAIYNANPNIQILFITPPLRADNANGSASVQEDHDRIKSYSDAIVQVCNKWEIPYFYGLTQSGINMYNYPKYLDAGKLHPSSSGNELYGARLAEWLRQYI